MNMPLLHAAAFPELLPNQWRFIQPSPKGHSLLLLVFGFPGGLWSRRQTLKPNFPYALLCMQTLDTSVHEFSTGILLTAKANR